MKKSEEFICENCEKKHLSWAGKCSMCNKWNSIIKLSDREVVNCIDEIKPLKVSQISFVSKERIKTKLNEIDRVLGGGFVKASVTLFGGAPGVGKSTLVLGIIKSILAYKENLNILYLSGEETCEQVAARSLRVKLNSSSMKIVHESKWEKIENFLNKNKFEFIVIDSIQTLYSENINSLSGSISQIKIITECIIKYAKNNNTTILIIGHINKEGGLAGPKTLEHMVDTVISLDKDLNSNVRVLSSSKNRFGSVEEIGLLKMEKKGFVPHCENIFSNYKRKENYVGCALSCFKSGSRVFYLEIETLAVENKLGTGKRVIYGIDINRVSLLLAIIEKFLKIPVNSYDVYINVVGVSRSINREIDLAIIASLISSFKSIKISNNLIFLGEVGLSGRIRPIYNCEEIKSEFKSNKEIKLVTKIEGKNEDQNLINIASLDELMRVISTP